MFAAIILVCGLPDNLSPEIVMGCGLIHGSSPFPTEELCIVSNTMFLEQAKLSLPQGAYFQDVKCVELSVSS